MEGRDILEAIHKVDKEVAALSAKVCADIANIKDLAIGNYKELSREVTNSGTMSGRIRRRRFGSRNSLCGSSWGFSLSWR